MTSRCWRRFAALGPCFVVVASTCARIGDACLTNDDCPGDGYCDYPDDRCGEGVSGTCAIRPERINPIRGLEVCGCDGVTYGHPGSAAAVGVDVNVEGGCVPPEGEVTCGGTFCPNDGRFACVLGDDELPRFRNLPEHCIEDPSCASCYPSCDTCSVEDGLVSALACDLE